jgi:choline/ethanolamine kinase
MVLVDTPVPQKSTSVKPQASCGLEALQTPVEGDREIFKYGSIELPYSAYKQLHKLAGKWTDILDPNELTLTRLKGAMTNNVYECHWKRENGIRDKKVLVRVYGEGSGFFFDREDEVLTFERMSQKGQGPKLLGRFPNGRVEEFLRARTLSKHDIRNPEISKKVAVKLLEFHHLDMPGERKAKIWKRLRDWLEKILAHSESSELNDFGVNEVADGGIDPKKLDDEINWLQRRLDKRDYKIGFCHNDLQYGNIMLSEKDDSVTLIDYEYSSYNPVAFDIANHFCEMTADYHTDEPHTLHPDLYPNDEEQNRFLRAYLEASGDEVSQADVDKLREEVKEFVLASHLHWVLWGLLSAKLQDVEFDFMGYSKQRFSLYKELKRQIES